MGVRRMSTKGGPTTTTRPSIRATAPPTRGAGWRRWRFGAGANYIYEYGYNPAGRVTMQRMQVTQIGNNSATADLDATYTWDNEGRVTARTYPSLPANQGANVTYQYDLMGRLGGLSLNGTSQATATYGRASELTNLTY